MLNRRPTYLMQIDAEIEMDLPLAELRKDSAFAALPEDVQRAEMINAVTNEVMRVANEEIQLCGGKIKKRIKQPGGDREQETGSELLVNDLGENHMTFSVAFQSDHDSAIAVVDLCVKRVDTFNGVRNIGHASLRGTDGTNLHHYDESIVAMAESLDEDTRNRIDEIMDPSRRED